MKQNAKFPFAVLVLLVIIEILSGCQYEGQPKEKFDDETIIIGQLSHGVVKPTLDASGLQAVCKYTGGQFKLDYYVMATGSAKDVGFLLFLDGIPQPYQVNGVGKTNYLNMLQLQEDNQKFEFSFVFSPVTGTTGDTLTLKIYSIYCPQYQPDMVNSFGYGIYHSMLEAAINIHFESDVEPKEEKPDVRTKQATLSSVKIISDVITDDFIVANFGNNLEVDAPHVESLLENNVYDLVSYNGEMVYDGLDITNQESVRVAYQIAGKPGAVYRISMFANHEPLTDGKNIVWDVALSESTLVTLEAYIDVSVLEDFTTFYVIASPIDDRYTSNSAALFGKKTNSILLYRIAKE